MVNSSGLVQSLREKQNLGLWEKKNSLLREHYQRWFNCINPGEQSELPSLVQRINFLAAFSLNTIFLSYLNFRPFYQHKQNAYDI